MNLSGEGGLSQQLTKLVLESPLEGELDAHLGYAKHDPAGRTGGNSRNGRRARSVVTEVFQDSHPPGTSRSESQVSRIWGKSRGVVDHAWR